MPKTFVLPVMLAGFALAGLTPALAAEHGDGGREAAAMAAVQVSLTQAIATAERHTGGKAYDAGVNDRPRGVQTVTIDGASGQVTGSHAGGEQD